MHYATYNLKTKSNLYFSSKKELNKWIKNHFRSMTPKIMDMWVVIKYIDEGTNPNFYQRIQKAFQIPLTDYILNQLKI